jgi:hypothetical protein
MKVIAAASYRVTFSADAQITATLNHYLTVARERIINSATSLVAFVVTVKQVPRDITLVTRHSLCIPIR